MKKPIIAALAAVLVFAFGLASGLQGQEIVKQYKLRVRVDSAAVHNDRDSKSATITWVAKGREFTTTVYDGEWFLIHVPTGQGGMSVPGFISRFDVDVLSEKDEKGPDYFDNSPDAFKGIGIQLKFAGGYSFFAGGDIETGAKGAYATYLARAQAKGYTIQSQDQIGFTHGPEGNVDVILSFNPTFGIGIGGSFLKKQAASTFHFAENNIYVQTFWDTPAISAFSIRAEAYYNIALSPRLGLSLHGGPAYFHATYNYDRTYDTSMVEDELNQQATGGTIGLNAGAALAFSINSKVAFMVELRGRYARFTNLQGTEKLVYTEMTTTITEASGSVYLITTEANPRLAVLSDAAAAAAGAQKASLDLSGITLQAGVIIRF